MTNARRPSIYDQLRPHLDAGDLIRRLGLVEARQLGSESYCKPLCHESSSGESLQINLHTGRWNCKACQHAGMRGDLIQLVEYAISGGRAPSHGEQQGSSSTHREAIQWLCQQFAIPFDESRATSDAGVDVVHLFAMLAHKHLLGSPRVLEWIQERWGFDLATVEAYGIGFMTSPLLPELVEEAQRSGSRDAFRSSGLGWYTPEGRWRTRFEGRVTFPYLEHGRAVYLIGRATPWTPALDDGRKPPKYHKLSVHSDQRPFISERVTNDHLYNESIMGSTDTVVIAEGVADAVALSNIGVPVVSPVTISFNATDLERFTRKARENGIHRAEILFDNELSGSGNWAARRVGMQLVERGLVARILTLPLGPDQERARDEVIAALGRDKFEELERSDPRERKDLIASAIADDAKRAWVQQNIEASKIDAAEWTSHAGAGAAGRFNEIRKAGRDVVDMVIADVVAKGIDPNEDPTSRIALFDEVIGLVAHINDGLARGAYAGKIAKAAGAGVTKTEVQQRISAHRKSVVRLQKEEQAEAARAEPQPSAQLVLLPPEIRHNQPKAPEPPKKPVAPGTPAAPPPPGAKHQSDHQRYKPVRDSVTAAVEAKLSPEHVGEHVAQTITLSMGYTPFRTPDEMYLVRGNERVPVGLERTTARFESLLFLASGLTPKKAAHRAYIAAVVYFLESGARKADDVSWSFVASDGAVFFPMGDDAGGILKIEPGRVTKTRMAEARVPAVTGSDFVPLAYVDFDGGVRDVLDAFRWTSLSPGDRLILVHWIMMLPILRRVGTVPLVRIEGGTSSGKTRTIEAVSFLVNGKKGSSVPTAAALVSRMSTEMLTIDDNRETGDVSPAFLGTLLQATHLGAREKRKVNSDTGTVIERVCGALIMNGVEPIHDGRSELASRMLTLRCDRTHRSDGSPTSEAVLRETVLANRNAFWSEAARRCAAALLLDQEHGEHLGDQIEEVFGVTKIGRLSAYLRLMYLGWVAGLPIEAQPAAAAHLDPDWHAAFLEIGHGALESLLREELAVDCLCYAFAHGAATAKSQGTVVAGISRTAFDGRYVEADGEAYLGPLRVTQLAQIVREAGKAMNAPPQVATRLRAGQLEQRILDGMGFLQAAGFEVVIELTNAGRRRFTFRRGRDSAPTAPTGVPGGGDTWTGP